MLLPILGRGAISSNRRSMGQTGRPQCPRPLQVMHFITLSARPL